MKLSNVVLPLAMALTAVNAGKFLRPFQGLDPISVCEDESVCTAEVAVRALRGSSSAALAMTTGTNAIPLMDGTGAVASVSSDTSTVLGFPVNPTYLPASSSSLFVSLSTTAPEATSSAGSIITSIILSSSYPALSISSADYPDSSSSCPDETETAATTTTISNHKVTTEVITVTFTSSTSNDASTSLSVVETSTTAVTSSSSDVPSTPAASSSSIGSSTSDVLSTAQVSMISTADIENLASILSSTETSSSSSQQTYPSASGTETQTSSVGALASSSVTTQAAATTIITLSVIPLPIVSSTSQLTTTHITETLTSSSTHTYTVTVFTTSSSSTQSSAMEVPFSTHTFITQPYSLAALPGICTESTVYITVTGPSPASQQTGSSEAFSAVVGEGDATPFGMTTGLMATILPTVDISSNRKTATSLTYQSYTTPGVQVSNDALSGSVPAFAATSMAPAAPSPLGNTNTTINTTTKPAVPAMSPFLTPDVSSGGGNSITAGASAQFSYLALVASYIAAIWLLAV